MAKKPYWQDPGIRRIHNEAAITTLRQLLESNELVHLDVLSRGDHIVLYSEDRGEKVSRIRLTRIDVLKDGDRYDLGIADHMGRWESTPFTGTLDELFKMITEQFGWLLDDY